MNDYNMIQEILEGLSHFAESPYVSKLYKLLETLQLLSKSLLDAKERLGPQKKVTPWYPTTMRKSQTSGNYIPEDSNVVNEVSAFISESPNPQEVVDFGEETAHSEDELMWHLFTSNMSFDWFDTSITIPDPAMYY